MSRVSVVAYDERWPHAFAVSSEEVSAALRSNLIEIHHIGSTSIPGIYAKPIIDMLAVVRDLTAIDQRTDRMESLGYEAMGEFGIPGRRYFRRNASNGQRTEHVHAFVVGSVDVLRHLAFRDYLRAFPKIADRYSDLKRRLAAANTNDIDAYIHGKNGFIKEVEASALAWREGHSG